MILTFAFLIIAGFAAGLLASVAGLASLVSYPALLAVGLPPVIANVTNTTALIFWGSAPPFHLSENSTVIGKNYWFLLAWR